MSKPIHSQKSDFPTCDEMDKLLDQRIEHPEDVQDIDAKLRAQFEREKTIFVLDMSGFSRVTQRYGIIHYLSMIRRMRRIVEPVITKHKGTVIKFEADNCFAIFNEPVDAVNATQDIHHDLSVANLMTADESDIYVSIGIGHGPVLVACDDMYGNELNLASKLGEDVAEKSEVLLTETAREKITDANYEFEAIPITVSGVEINAFRLKNKN